MAKRQHATLVVTPSKDQPTVPIVVLGSMPMPIELVVLIARLPSIVLEEFELSVILERSPLVIQRHAPHVQVDHIVKPTTSISAHQGSLA